jgi:glycosyltransferase involved in cell wall biosynthesis
MRIVYLNPVGALGGAERSLLDMMASVRQAVPGADLSLIVATAGPLIEEAEKIGVRVKLQPMPTDLVKIGDSGWRSGISAKSKLRVLGSLPYTGLATWSYLHNLRSTFAELRPDLIHSNGIKFHLLGGLAAHLTWPVIWHIRDFLSLRPLVARLLRWAAHRVQGGIAISHAVEQDMRSTLGPLPVEMIYNAVDTQLFSPGLGDGKKLDELAGLPPTQHGTLRVGLVATFARWKGHELFVQSASQLVRDFPDLKIRFYIVGGPIYSTRGSQYSEPELRTKIGELGLASKFGLIGYQQNPSDIYRSLDVVVHASTQPEPFGRTIVEAMACGKPVIVAEAGGAKELFTCDHDAVGFPPGNVAALARRIKQLTDAPSFRTHLAANARRTAVTRFDRARFGPQILAAYRQFLQVSSR